MRVRITIKGTVQGVGYRDEVRRRALELGLTGMARNLPDGSVEVIAEGEHDRLKGLVTSLKSAEPPLQVNALIADYQESKGCFDDFLVVRDLEHNGKTEQKLEQGIEYLKQTNGSIRAMHDGLNSNIKSMHENLGSKLDETRIELSSKLDETRNELSAKLDENKDAVVSMDGHLGAHIDKLDKKYDRFGDKMDELTRDIKELKELFKVFVEHYLARERGGEPA